MSKIKIEDVEYTLYTDELSRYDGYYFKGEIHKYEPVDSRVIGYEIGRASCRERV